MKAKRIDGQAVNGSRNVLAEVLPLDTPYAITIFPIYACNFKCNYCLHSLEKEKRGHVSSVVSMDLDLYKKCIDDISHFPNKLKVLHFIGYGEPLLHKDIVKMVEYAVDRNVANTVDIVTNGSLLTPQLSRALINAGLSSLRISLQGLNSTKYKEVCDVKIDYAKFIENIRYFYENRGNTRVHIKIIDTGLKDFEDQDFINKFSNICDTIAVEHLVPVIDKINYTNNSFGKNQLGNEISHCEICPQPFYFMQINPDGKCVPCCNGDIPIYLGDCKTESANKIWNNIQSNSFRRMHLKKEKSINQICSSCKQYIYSMYPEEILDNDCDALLKFYE